MLLVRGLGGRYAGGGGAGGGCAPRTECHLKGLAATAVARAQACPRPVIAAAAGGPPLPPRPPHGWHGYEAGVDPLPLPPLSRQPGRGILPYNGQ